VDWGWGVVWKGVMERGVGGGRKRHWLVGLIYNSQAMTGGSQRVGVIVMRIVCSVADSVDPTLQSLYALPVCYSGLWLASVRRPAFIAYLIDSQLAAVLSWLFNECKHLKPIALLPITLSFTESADRGNRLRGLPVRIRCRSPHSIRNGSSPWRFFVSRRTSSTRPHRYMQHPMWRSIFATAP